MKQINKKEQKNKQEGIAIVKKINQPSETNITYSVRLSNGAVATNPNDIERLTKYGGGYY